MRDGKTVASKRHQSRLRLSAPRPGSRRRLVLTRATSSCSYGFGACQREPSGPRTSRSQARQYQAIGGPCPFFISDSMACCRRWTTTYRPAMAAMDVTKHNQGNPLSSAACGSRLKSSSSGLPATIPELKIRASRRADPARVRYIPTHRVQSWDDGTRACEVWQNGCQRRRNLIHFIRSSRCSFEQYELGEIELAPGHRGHVEKLSRKCPRLSEPRTPSGHCPPAT